MASHPSPPTPLSAAADAKRRRILDAARAVCARRGVDRARMDEIAAEAQVSKGTLYNFFASKESLIVASILAHYERTELRVQAELGEPLPPAAQLDRLVESLIELFPDIIAEMVVNFQAWGVAVRDAGARDELFSALRALYAERCADLEQLVHAGVASGEFAAGVDPRLFTDGFMALFDGFVYRAAFDPDGASVEKLRACLGEHVRRTLEPGGAPPDTAHRKDPA